jgi:hypothetical protein
MEPKSIRYNNPGNLRPMKEGFYKGQIGVDADGFALFETTEMGQKALDQDIGIKLGRKPTIDAFINQYSGIGDPKNSQASVDNYKIAVMEGLGLNSSDQVIADTPENRKKMRDIISKFESGIGVPADNSGQEQPKESGAGPKPSSISEQAGEAIKQYASEVPLEAANTAGKAYLIAENAPSFFKDMTNTFREESAAAKAASAPTEKTSLQKVGKFWRPVTEKLPAPTPAPVNKIPVDMPKLGALGRGLGIGGAGLSGYQAKKDFEAGNYGQAALNSLGAVGSLASLIPHPVARVAGNILGISGPVTAEYFRKRQEEEEEEEKKKSGK